MNFTAEQAKKISEEIRENNKERLQESVNIQLEEIYKSIKLSSFKGANSCLYNFYYKNYYEEIINDLNQKGFTVKNMPYNKSQIIIMW